MFLLAKESIFEGGRLCQWILFFGEMRYFRLMQPLHLYLGLGALLFLLGVALVLTRRNAIMVLMGIELMLNAANVNFVAFSRYNQPAIEGQMAALFVIVLAAAEVAVGLGLILNLFRRKGSIDLAKAQELQG